MTKTESKESAPMPVTFPAMRADFLRLVIATEDAAERYDKFLSDGVKAICLTSLTQILSSNGAGCLPHFFRKNQALEIG
jgi:hypothetical protein